MAEQNHPGLLKHNTRPIFFTLDVGNFAIKFASETDTTPLINTLKKDCDIKVHREAAKYIGLTME